MSKYKVNLKYYLSDNIDVLSFYDNNNNKRIKDIKELINSYNNLICPCMLIIPKKSNLNEYFEDDAELNMAFEKSIINIFQISDICTCNFLLENKKKLTLSKKALIEQYNKLNESNKDKYIDNNMKDFYDIKIDINSLINLQNGWKIEMTKKGENMINFCNKEMNKCFCILGVLGNINSGKSFLLSKLFDINMPSESFIDNKGLCVKYGNLNEYSNLYKGYVFLDSKGSNRPILDNIDKLHDIISTESFIQNFIILYSNIILLVINNLSVSEQKLINKIKNNLKLFSNKDKKLIIIHNLKDYKKIEEIRYYIDNILIKSSSFKLKKNETITSKKDNAINGEYYTEISKNRLNVFHLIFAADKSEAGLYFNTFTKYFIEIHYKEIISLNNFNIFENFKKHIISEFKIYFNHTINEDDFIPNEQIIREKIIRFKNKKELYYRNNYSNDLGLNILEDNYFCPKYSIYKINHNIEIRIELPGNILVDILKPKFIDNGLQIIIVGNKFKDKKQKEKVNDIIDNRSYGKFIINIKFDCDYYQINPNIKSYSIINGILTLVYEIEDNSDNKMVLIDDEVI